MCILVCWNKLQRIVEITVLFCMHVVRDRTDQLDNKDIASKEFIERNEQRRKLFWTL